MTATLFDQPTTDTDAQTPEAVAAPVIENRAARHTITATWTIGEPFPAESISDETHQRVVVLTCDHDSNRKGFTAALRVQHDIYRNGRLFGTQFALFADPMVRLAGEPIVRYSAKHLQEFFDKTLEHVTQARARGEHSALFEPPTTAA